jgi:4-nitrophenyl phosphatase
MLSVFNGDTMKQFLNSIKGLILDMDGVLWKDTEPIGDLPAIFAKIRTRSLKVMYATNNSTRDENQYVAKLAGFGVSSDPSQVVTSSNAAADLLLEHFPNGGPLYIIGETGLRNILLRNGFFHSETSPVAVVVGMDRQVTYDKMSRAAIFIQNGIKFFGTNPDKSFPTPEGQAIGTGAILAAIAAATGVEPHIAGKPLTRMVDMALKRMKLPASEVLVVGDRIETDILSGKKAGCQTALVLSGVTDRDSAQKANQADYIFQDLNEIVDLLGNHG